MAEVSQKYKYVKLDDGVSFALVRTNPKLTTNTKLMYNGKKMYMESYASGELLNRSVYKNVPVKQNGTFNKDIANFLVGSGSQAYNVYQNFSDVTISDSFDNQFETLYWCGAEYIDSSFYEEEIGFVAPLYLREKLPNYFLIFRIDSPSNYNLVIDEETKKPKDSRFDFKTDILDKAVLIKTFDLREGTVLGDYIHRYIDQDSFEFDKSMYVNFANGEVTYYGINKIDGVLEKKVENFENELLKNDSPILTDDKWFTEGFERNSLIFPYIMNIEYLFDDYSFINNGVKSYDFARYIGVYCNNIEFGEFDKLEDLSNSITEDNAIYYFEDNRGDLHRYSNSISDRLKIDGKDAEDFDEILISGFEKDRVTGYAEPLDIYEGFINRAQYGFEILKPLEPGDWIGIEYEGRVECYFADNKNIDAGIKTDMMVGEYSDFRFSVNENSTINDIAEALVKSINRNKKSKFEAKCSDNVVVIYAKREGKEYNGGISEDGISFGAKILMEKSLIYNRKISLPVSNSLTLIRENDCSIEDISDSDGVNYAAEFDEFGNIIKYDKSSFGDYYIDYFCGACNIEIDPKTDTYKNVFKIYNEESLFFAVGRYIKTNNGDGRRICTNMFYLNAEGKIDPEYRLVIIDDKIERKKGNGYDVAVSSTYQVEIMDIFKPNYGVLSWFPVKDFDFDINYSIYGQYGAFVDECNKLSKNITYTHVYNTKDTADSDFTSTQEESIYGINELAKSPFFDDYDNSLETEYDYYFEGYHPNLCLMSKVTPYISKWGYYDEQKDSCENPYRLNVSKIFGVSNLSSNIFLRNCDETHYTHSMPYYMTLSEPDYIKEYQYISSDEIYRNYNDGNKTYFDCVDYWLNMFMRTDDDMFSYFFRGKKYGKRFDKKYSRILGGDKFHNPSTLFRGVKFEVIRQYNGEEKRTSEYNNYKFSFIYIPVMVKSMIFNNTVHFVKNDTFKFIVGIVFVNSMLGEFDHNIFKGSVNYFNKGFIYAACKDIIRPENTNKYTFNLYISRNSNGIEKLEGETNEIWENEYDVGSKDNIFHMWLADDGNTVFVSNTKDVKTRNNIIGEFNCVHDSNQFAGVDIVESVKNIGVVKTSFNSIYDYKEGDEFKISWGRYYDEYDATIYGYNTFKYYGYISCEMIIADIDLTGNILEDICDIELDYFSKVLQLYFKSQSLKNILTNMGDRDSVKSIRFSSADESTVIIFENKNEEKVITVDESGNITINSAQISDLNDENIKNLKMDIVIKDYFDTNYDSLGFKNYFSVFEQLSAHSITECVNSNFNVKYYSTVEDNKYKIRIIEPDCIEVEDRYEAIPVKITENNKNVVGSIEIKEKQNIDKIGIKVINRYSGYYNPIFNDILYYDDYTYTTNIGRLRNGVKFEMPYSNTYINYDYKDSYGEFGVIKNMYYHKTNLYRSDEILKSKNPVYPAINEYAISYRDYNIFSSSWDEGYFISQDDLETRSICNGIGSMKEGLCMFGSKYLNLPDYIFIDTFENGTLWDEKIVMDIRDNTDIEIIYKEINDKTVRYLLFIEKRLKRYLSEYLYEVFAKYINKNYSFGHKATIEDDVEEYVEKNLLKLYKVEKIYMYIKEERMGGNNRKIENVYLKHMSDSNEDKIHLGFPVVSVIDGVMLKDSKFTMEKINEFDRIITYNLKSGFKESFGFGVSFRRK